MPTPQAPIGSSIGAASTAAEVIAGRLLVAKRAVQVHTRISFLVERKAS